MRDDYSVWDLFSRMLLAGALSVMLLLLVEVSAEVGALESAHEPLVMMAIYALVGYMMIPPVQILTTHSYRKAREFYQSRAA